MNNYYEELYHYGVKGMKWGILRYQNEDGSLTEEGKRKYGTAENLRRVAADDLNRNDKIIAYNNARMKEYSATRQRLEDKRLKAESKGKEKKALKYENKIAEVDSVISEYKQSINEGKKITDRVIKNMEKAGLSVSKVATYRNTTSGAQHVANILSMTAVAAVGGYGYTRTEISDGTQYKIYKNQNGK